MEEANILSIQNLKKTLFELAEIYESDIEVILQVSKSETTILNLRQNIESIPYNASSKLEDLIEFIKKHFKHSYLLTTIITRSPQKIYLIGQTESVFYFKTNSIEFDEEDDSRTTLKTLDEDDYIG